MSQASATTQEVTSPPAPSPFEGGIALEIDDVENITDGLVSIHFVQDITGIDPSTWIFRDTSIAENSLEIAADSDHVWIAESTNPGYGASGHGWEMIPPSGATVTPTNGVII